MRTLLVPLVLVGFVPASAVEPGRQATGTWNGHWTRNGDTLRVVMRIDRDPQTGALRGSFDSDRLRVAAIPITDILLEGCCKLTFRVAGDRTTAEFSGVVRNGRLTGTFAESDGPGAFAFRRASRPPARIHEEAVTFSSAGATLSGTLLLPAGRRPAPAVLFVHGAGAEGRWASRFLATRLAEHGVGALIFDKRGVGGSSGDWRTASVDDLAADAVAGIELLRSHPRIDPKRIGLHGHSQGGTLAPMIAARSGHVAFLVGSAAAGTPVDSTELFSVFNSVRGELQTPTDSVAAAAFVAEVVTVAYHGRPRDRLDSLAVVYRGRPWCFPLPAPEHHYWAFSRRFAEYDPLRWWRQIRVPVLLLYGSTDQRVPAEESARRIEATLRGAGNGRVTVRIFSGADHTFRLPAGPGGWPNTVPEYLPALLDWIETRAASAGSPGR